MTRSARPARLRRDGRAPLAPQRGGGIGGNRLCVIFPRGRAVLNVGSLRLGQIQSQEFPLSTLCLRARNCQGIFGAANLRPQLIRILL